MSNSINVANNLIVSKTKIWPQSSPELQGVVEYICENHGLDIYRNFASLTLEKENPACNPVVFSMDNISSTRNIYGAVTGKIMLAHYIPTSAGGGERPVIAMMFYFVRDITTNCAIWTPFEVEINEAVKETREGYSFSCSEWVVSKSIKLLTPEIIQRQADLNELARKWTTKLTDEGFTIPPYKSQCARTIEKSKGSEPLAERHS